MKPEWKDDKTRSEYGDTGLEVVQGHRAPYMDGFMGDVSGDGWWILDKRRGDKPSEYAVEFCLDRDAAKGRAEIIFAFSSEALEKSQRELDKLTPKRLFALLTLEKAVAERGEAGFIASICDRIRLSSDLKEAHEWRDGAVAALQEARDDCLKRMGKPDCDHCGNEPEACLIAAVLRQPRNW